MNHIMVRETKDQKLARLEQENIQLRLGGFYQHVVVPTETITNLHASKIPTLRNISELDVTTSPNAPNIHLTIGDNLGALIALTPKYENCVDVIYIDPPYNTGYRDRYTYNDRTGGVPNSFDAHSGWVSFMNPRLRVAQRFLRETGVIIVAVGSNELAHLKLLMNTIFGETNFITTLTVEGMPKNNSQFISTGNEYWLVYAKNVPELKKQKIKWRTPKKSATIILKKAKQFWKQNPTATGSTKLLRKYFSTPEATKMFLAEPGLKMYNRIDSTGRVYRAGDLSSPGKGRDYEVINPNSGKPVMVPSRGWVHAEETFNQMVEDKKILWSGTKTPSYKRYLDESMSVVRGDIITASKNNPTRVLQQMIGRNKFTFPKDHTVVADWVDYVIPEFRKADMNDPVVVMDFFAGSGTTGHAVATLNGKYKTNFECVLVTADENEIPTNVTIPRLKATITGEWKEGLQEALPGNLLVNQVIYVPVDEISSTVFPDGFIKSVVAQVELLKNTGNL